MEYVTLTGHVYSPAYNRTVEYATLTGHVYLPAYNRTVEYATLTGHMFTHQHTPGLWSMLP